MLKKLSQTYKQEKASESQLSILSSMKVDTGENVTASEARAAIREEFTLRGIGPIQKLNVLRVVESLDELEQILKRKINYIGDITIADYQRIMAVKGTGGTLFLKSINHPCKVRDGDVVGSREYGWQETEVCKDGRFYYLVSYDICMLDIDANIGERKESNMSLDDIKIVAERLGVTCRVYKTYNGYHVFITSRRLHYQKDQELLEFITKEFKSDIYYKVFSQKFGYKVRLNAKIRGEGRVDIVAEYVGKFGSGEYEDEGILEYLGVHDLLVKHHGENDSLYEGEI